MENDDKTKKGARSQVQSHVPQHDLVRSLPQAMDAEKGVLSCFLHNPTELLNDAQTTIPEEMFHHPCHRLLYQVMLEFNVAMRPVEYIALSTYLQDKRDEIGGRSLMDQIGGQGFLAELLDFVPTPAHYGYYKGILRDKWLLRKQIANCTKGIEEAYEYQEDVTQVLLDQENRAFEALQEAQKTAEQRSGPKPARVIAAEWAEHIENIMRDKGKEDQRGVRTLWHDIDRSFHNFDDNEGEVIVIAGRPGMGKTAILNSMLHNIGVVQKIPTAVFSIEMTQNQLMPRVILGPLGIDTSKALTGMFAEGKNGSRDEVKEMMASVMEFARCPIHIDWSSSINTADLRLRVQTLKRMHGIRVVFIDYLRLVKPVGKAASVEERLHLTEVMETARWIAKELKLVVFVLAQMNRDSDHSPGKPPVLADLAGSASIEQDSHFVFILHRPSYYFPWNKLKDDAKKQWVESYKEQREANPEMWSKGELYPTLTDGCERQDYEEHTLFIARKVRRGPTADFWLRFQGSNTFFRGRTPKLWSGKLEERQVGYDSTASGPGPVPAKTKMAPESQAHLKCPKPGQLPAKNTLLEGYEPGDDDRAER